MSFLNVFCALKLNRCWAPIAVEGFEKALTGLYKGVYMALSIDGEEIVPLDWEHWLELPIRENDSFISCPKFKIRLPTVIITKHYGKMPIVEPKLTKKAILERDNYTCQFTGKKLEKSELTVDHLQPVSRNGKNDWSNLVACDKTLNRKKGNKTLKEFGMKLIREPSKPLPKVAASRIKPLHKDWEMFLIK